MIFAGLALVLYSLSVGAMVIRRQLRSWQVWLGGGAIIAQALGLGLSVQLSGNFSQLPLKDGAGLAALIILLFHVSWMQTVTQGKTPVWNPRHGLFGVGCWGLWLVATTINLVGTWWY